MENYMDIAKFVVLILAAVVLVIGVVWGLVVLVEYIQSKKGNWEESIKAELEYEKAISVMKKEEVKLANKETRYDKDGAEMTFAFYPKDLIISIINAFADKGVTVLGSIEYFCGIPSQIHHSFGCQITTIIDQINDIPCNVLLSGHLVFLKKGK